MKNIMHYFPPSTSGKTSPLTSPLPMSAAKQALLNLPFATAIGRIVATRFVRGQTILHFTWRDLPDDDTRCFSLQVLQFASQHDKVSNLENALLLFQQTTTACVVCHEPAPCFRYSSKICNACHLFFRRHFTDRVRSKQINKHVHTGKDIRSCDKCRITALRQMGTKATSTLQVNATSYRLIKKGKHLSGGKRERKMKDKKSI